MAAALIPVASISMRLRMGGIQMFVSPDTRTVLSSSSTIFSGEPSAMEEAEFEAIVKANPGVMVNFMAPWCFWSNKLTPDWLACGKRLHKRAYSQSVGFLRVDCTKSRKLCETQMVHAFPTIRTYRGTVHSLGDVDRIITGTLRRRELRDAVADQC